MTGTVDWKTISDIAEEYLYNPTADDDDDAHNPQRGMVPIETERRETKETILEATATTTTAMAGGRNTQSPVRQQALLRHHALGNCRHACSTRLGTAWPPGRSISARPSGP